MRPKLQTEKNKKIAKKVEKVANSSIFDFNSQQVSKSRRPTSPLTLCNFLRYVKCCVNCDFVGQDLRQTCPRPCFRRDGLVPQTRGAETASQAFGPTLTLSAVESVCAEFSITNSTLTANQPPPLGNRIGPRRLRLAP